MINNIRFHSPLRGTLSIDEMIDEISDFVYKYPGNFYRLVIGTDSQARKINGKSELDFVTAIIVHRIGRGARYFWHKEKKSLLVRNEPSYKEKALRNKIYTETLMSLDIAQIIVPLIRKHISPKKYDFEIHVDVGPLGPTREMINEVVGMVNGNGFKAKTKPESWGASSVADKYT